MANPRCYKCEVSSYYLSCFSAPQGLLCPGRIHPYLALLLHRDDFHRPNASLSCSFLPQGLFCPVRMHLYLALFFHRDDFRRPDSSLPCSFSPQGLFPPPGFISILLFSSAGITSSARIHPQLALFHCRDYFHRTDSSLSCSSVPQGLFPPHGFIPSLLFCAAGIISAARIHLYLVLPCCRDYF